MRLDQRIPIRCLTVLIVVQLTLYLYGVVRLHRSTNILAKMGRRPRLVRHIACEGDWLRKILVAERPERLMPRATGSRQLVCVPADHGLWSRYLKSIYWKD